ncbi:MAG: ABC transporter substrate-binding protein [Actinomycetia bacterium]|nr:ABC transporter substrate-binding protein [Actinomycetes bacterium]
MHGRFRTGQSRRRAFCAAVVALVVASSCGGSDDKDSTDSSASTATGSAGADTTAVDAPATVIKIGFAYPDLSGIAALNPKAGLGDPALQAEAVVNGWMRDGLLPAGMTIELVPEAYNIIDRSAQEGVCVSLAEDHDVFAVAAGIQFLRGTECLADRYSVPVIGADGTSRDSYERGAPYMFTLRADTETQLRTFGRWAVESGALEGKRIGLYYETPLEAGVAAMKDEFAAAGYEVVSESTSTGIGMGGPEDIVAWQRFIEDDVDVVLPLIGSSSAQSGYFFAAEQGYQPLVLDLDYEEHTQDLVGKTNPDWYVGTQAMTMTRVGEIGTEFDTAAAEACLANYESYAGVDIPRTSPTSPETNSILQTCDVLAVVLAGLQSMTAPDADAFVAGIENAGEFHFASVGDGAFSATDHSATDNYRIVQFSGDCTCWVAISDFAPMVRE